MPEDGQRRSKHAACIDESNKICCGLRYKFINFKDDVPQRRELCKTDTLNI